MTAHFCCLTNLNEYSWNYMLFQCNIFCKGLLAYNSYTSSYEKREWECDHFVTFCRRSRRGGGCMSVTRRTTCWSPPPYRSWPSRTRRRSVLVPLNFYVLKFSLYNVEWYSGSVKCWVWALKITKQISHYLNFHYRTKVCQ